MNSPVPFDDIAPSRATVGGVRRYVAIVAFALAGIAVADLSLFLLHRRTERWVERSRYVMTLAQDANLLAVDRETGIRGFLLSRDSTALEPEVAARTELAADMQSLVTMTADGPEQQERARAIAGTRRVGQRVCRSRARGAGRP